MNGLEKTIFGSATGAQRLHIDMTGGWWLWDGPESFLQHTVARSITRKAYEVFIEASPAKIAKEHDKPLRGRPTKMKQKRFDIVVWQKTDPPRLRATIE